MCRRNQLLGFCALSFGLGMLIGKCLVSGLLCNLCGVILILIGFCSLRRK